MQLHYLLMQHMHNLEVTNKSQSLPRSLTMIRSILFQQLLDPVKLLSISWMYPLQC